MTPTQTRSSAHARGVSTASASGSAFVEGSVTPRRIAAIPGNSNGARPTSLYRPKSRDGPSSMGGLANGLSMTRRTSAELTGGLSKSRLPRTSMLRGSRSSLASVSTTSSSNLRASREDEEKTAEKQIPALATPRRELGAGLRIRDRERDRDMSKRNSVIGMGSFGLSSGGGGTKGGGTATTGTATMGAGKRRNRTTNSGDGKLF